MHTCERCYARACAQKKDAVTALYHANSLRTAYIASRDAPNSSLEEQS